MLLQTQSVTVRPLTTAHLAQTMTLLELNSDELRQKIEAELASNPALELADQPRCPHCRRLLVGSSVCPACRAASSQPSQEPIVFISPSTDFISYRDAFLDDEMQGEDQAAVVEELPAFVLRQIAPELEPDDRPLAAHILTSLDEDGLLTVPLVEIARYLHVLPSRVDKVLRLIQRAEPVGVGSPNPKAALLAQLEVLSETRPVPELATQAIEKGLDLLSRHAFIELGRLLGVSTAEARVVADFIIENLNPYPARAHWGDIHLSSDPPHVFQQPDILVSRLCDDPTTPLVVEIISPFAGGLRLNPSLRVALSEAPPEKAEEWQADLSSASLLIKCLQQRGHTLVRLMERLVTCQRRFLLEGNAFILPLTRAQLADELGLHESTISRAVANKALQLPNRRIVPLARLFDRNLHIRTALMEIIAKETRPLNDTEIAARLREQGFFIARRTVAKYRSMEGILPARLRHNNKPTHQR